MLRAQEPPELLAGVKGISKRTYSREKTFPKNEKIGRNVFASILESKTNKYTSKKAYSIPSIIVHVFFAR